MAALDWLSGWEISVQHNGNKKPFYRNAEDTLEDVGITLRQLGYWRKQGLFQPELGSKTKFFTEQDTDRLRFLKRMIVDLGLPVATVQRLISAAAEDEDDFFAMPVNTRTFIDLEGARLVYPPDAMSELVADAIVGAKPWRVERLFASAALLVVQGRGWRSSAPEVYEAQMRTLHARLDRLSLLARLQSRGDGKYYFWPRRESDPLLTDELVQQLLEEKKQEEGQINEARSRRVWK